MSKNVIKKGPNNYLQQQILDMQKDLKQLKAVQVTTVQGSSEYVTSLITINNGITWYFDPLVYLNPSGDWDLLSMCEWSVYNGSVSSANDYFQGFGGLDMGLVPIVSGYSYDFTQVLPYGSNTFYTKNAYVMTITNNSGSSIGVIIRLRFRYIGAPPDSAQS
jgi:hypothetical protein